MCNLLSCSLTLVWLVALQSEEILNLEEWRWALHLPNMSLTPEKYAQALGDLVVDSLDLDRLVEIAGTCKMPKCPEIRLALGTVAAAPVKIAVAKDEAFSFYFHE